MKPASMANSFRSVPSGPGPSRLNVRTPLFSSVATDRVVLDRVLAFGDAWFPNFGPPDLFSSCQGSPSHRAERPIEVHVANAPVDPRVLEQLEQAGVQRALPWIPAANCGQETLTVSRQPSPRCTANDWAVGTFSTRLSPSPLRWSTI